MTAKPGVVSDLRRRARKSMHAMQRQKRRHSTSNSLKCSTRTSHARNRLSNGRLCGYLASARSYAERVSSTFRSTKRARAIGRWSAIWNIRMDPSAPITRTTTL
jgi:hypothetical protein